MEPLIAQMGHPLPTGRKPAALDLELFVAQVATAAARGTSRLEGVLELARPSWESVRDWVRARPGRYTRSLAYRDEKVEVLVLTWTRGSAAPVHDHAAQRCWMVGVHGALEVTSYQRLSGGLKAGRAELEPLPGRRLLSAGEVDTPGPAADIHRVSPAPGVALAVTVHVYARPIDRCLVFDLPRQRCEERRLRYDFVGPLRRRARFSSPAVPAGHHPEPSGVRGWLSRLARRTLEEAQQPRGPADPDGPTVH